MSNNTHLISLAEEASRNLDLAYIRLEQAQDLVEKLQAELCANGASSSAGRAGHASSSEIVVDRGTYSIRWRGSRCVIGPCIGFYFLETLSRRPNRFYTYGQLIEVVWRGEMVEDGTIRGAARDLRQLLKSHGMADLATAVRGKMKMYGLILDSINA